MPTDVKFRGCCCGVPFGCGVLALAAGVAVLWGFAAPAWCSLAWLPF